MSGVLPPGWGVPPFLNGGVPPSSDGGWYASCVHAGGLSCLYLTHLMCETFNISNYDDVVRSKNKILEICRQSFHCQILTMQEYLTFLCFILSYISLCLSSIPYHLCSIFTELPFRIRLANPGCVWNNNRKKTTKSGRQWSTWWEFFFVYNLGNTRVPGTRLTIALQELSLWSSSFCWLSPQTVQSWVERFLVICILPHLPARNVRKVEK